MGIDLNISHGFGLSIPEENFLEKVIPDFDEDPWLAVYEYCRQNYPDFELDEVGNQWSGDREWILMVSALSESHGYHDLEGGFTQIPQTTDETILSKFSELYEKLTGIPGKLPVPFIGVYWY